MGEVEVTAAEFERQMEAMRNKNRELLDELKAAKTSLREKDGIKPEDFAKLEQVNAELVAKLAETTGLLKKTTKERDDSIAIAQVELTANHKLLVDNGLTEALTKAGIRKELLPAARALLKEQGIISVESEGDVRRAVAKLTDGKLLPLEEYVSKHFAVSDEGKAFIPADGNSGGGSGGPGRPGAVAPDLKTQYDAAIKAGDANLALAIQGKMHDSIRS